MARRNPAVALDNPAHEAFVQRRAQGMAPEQAGLAAGLRDFRRVERQVGFQDRLRYLIDQAAGPASEDMTPLQQLEATLKRTIIGSSAANQYKNTLEATRQLAELYTKHPELRGDRKPSAPVVPLTPTQESDRRVQRESRLSVVSEAAANE